MFTRALALLAVLASPAAAQLRVVTYNTSDGQLGSTADPFAPGTVRRTAVTSVLQAIGTESVNGIARPVDVLLIQESRGAARSGQTFVDILNGLYGAGSYARGTVDGASTGAGTHTIVYRTATVDLVGELAVGTVSATGPARQPVRHQVRPDGYAAGDVFFYNAHWAAGDAAGRRGIEATQTRTDADALGAGVRAVFAGDFNLQGPGEAGYQNLLAPGGPGRAVDPVFSGTSWDARKELHSQSPVTDATREYPGQAGGGMDDRFDFLLPTANMAPGTGRGVRQIAGSYRVFGNNGSHELDGPLTSGSQPAGVLTALRQTSEHLPVVADYTLPARLSAAVSGTVRRVIRGQSAPVTLAVTNSAPVGVAAGADVLDYTFAGTGAVTDGAGSAAGLAALSPANTHVLRVPTTTAGSYTGTVTATPTSDQAATTFSPAAVAVTALDPATGSFSTAGRVASTAVDFGSVPAGQGATRQVAVYNLPSAAGAGLTAALRFRSIGESTAGGPITAVLEPTTGDLPAGSGNWTLTVQFAGSAPGSYADTLTLTLSDENILGATDQFLTVSVSAFVPVPEPGVVAFLLAAAGGVGYARRRGRAGGGRWNSSPCPSAGPPASSTASG